MHIYDVPVALLTFPPLLGNRRVVTRDETRVEYYVLAKLDGLAPAPATCFSFLESDCMVLLLIQNESHLVP
jgi:hypothetical protein